MFTITLAMAGSAAQIRNCTRQNIVRLLLKTAEQPPPSLGHFLLGYECNKPLAKSELQDAGVLGAPRTCLHAILSLLSRGVGTRTGPSALYATPQLAAMCFRLLYVLCAHKVCSSKCFSILCLSTGHGSANFALFEGVPRLRFQTGVSRAVSTFLHRRCWY